MLVKVLTALILIADDRKRDGEAQVSTLWIHDKGQEKFAETCGECAREEEGGVRRVARTVFCVVHCEAQRPSARWQEATKEAMFDLWQDVRHW